ncbi:hypothetical protein COV24_04745 [candidate division WWE3 bacterium CG10_big_fil_rev_8_21_14_0_10_32_10]|uniref:Uncharacterized protein n=1 Tax=candidate division WWE3 bacterium CG10_big_fil_rev_8_21_14_0_10_32_10 TaxID=1975090 RepID=A0A2H0R968_UNCKA|nr:MAG: hypothetical protein COV24_04745 [candidate division WWE3 bacterium CG10_big_fil_rev_8_21_14_0_10_32_10]
MKKTIATIIIVFTLLFGFQVVFAGTYKSNLETTRSTAGLEKSGSVESIVGNIIGIGLTFVGVLFLVLMIYAGIRWMLSRGNEQETAAALNTITAAVLGLFIVISAYAITNFVFDALKGGTETSQVSGGSCTDKLPPPAGCVFGTCGSLFTDITACETSNCCEWKI